MTISRKIKGEIIWPSFDGLNDNFQVQNRHCLEVDQRPLRILNSSPHCILEAYLGNQEQISWGKKT